MEGILFSSLFNGESSSWAMLTTEQLVLVISDPNLCQMAISQLNKRREVVRGQDLAPLLWNTAGTIAAILDEVLTIYTVLSTPDLITQAQSNRVCNALALFQNVASHPDTRMPFISACLPCYVIPILHGSSNSKPFEYMRLSSLGVIAALVKVDSTEAVRFLLNFGIIRMCLNIMETGSELSKTVATYITEKILLDSHGLNYICNTPESFYAVNRVLVNVVAKLTEEFSPKLLKHIIRCYLRMSDNIRACSVLERHLPDSLRDGTFSSYMDQVTRSWLEQLLRNVHVQNPHPVVQAGVRFEV